MESARFGLAQARKGLTLHDGAITTPRKDELAQSPVSYFDFTTDGTRVLDHLTVVCGVSLDVIGVVQETQPMETVAALERLLGHAPAELANGGVELYVCPECGSYGCGAVTARLDINDDTITWRAIGMQYDYTDEVFSLCDPDHFPSLRFDRRGYEQVLQNELDRIRPMCEF